MTALVVGLEQKGDAERAGLGLWDWSSPGQVQVGERFWFRRWVEGWDGMGEVQGWVITGERCWQAEDGKGGRE